MLFNSLEFILLFVPITAAGFYLLGTRGDGRPAVVWVVACSLFFYGYWNPGAHELTEIWRWWPLALIVTSVVVNYTIGQRLLAHPTKALLALGVTVNLGAIGFFKYAGFFANDVAQLDWNLGFIVLPLAISFFTFQQIAYLVDAYRGEMRADGFLNYALFVTFFPQLVAGPIVHHSETIPQFQRRETYRLRLDNLSLGLSIFVLGLAKKVILADGIAVYATPVFDDALAGDAPTLFEAWGGALAYTFQLYFDFAGYSDMAIGLALMFNIRLPLNFNSPYKATSIIDFWRRWHITLSRFLRAYVYVPLGGNRLGVRRRYVNLMITMLLGGLWHGAGWTFVAWGALHGLYLVINHAFRTLRLRLGHDLGRSTLGGRVFGWTLTFLAVVVGWVYFRAESFEAANTIIAGMLGLNGVQLPTSYFGFAGPLGPVLQDLGWVFRDETGFRFGGVQQVAFLFVLLIMAVFLPNVQQWTGYVPPHGQMPGDARPALVERLTLAFTHWRPTLVHGSMVGLLLCWCLLAAFAQTPTEFLYFQF